MDVVIKVLICYVVFFIIKRIIYVYRASKFNCEACDFYWTKNKNPHPKGYCYMHPEEPKYCIFDTAKHDKKLNRGRKK